MQQLPVDTGVKGYGDALRTLARAKTLWSLLIVLAVLVHVTGFVLAEFPFAGSPAPGEPSTAPTQPATKGGARDPALIAQVATVIDEALPIARLVAPIAAGLLTVVALLAVLVALSGRLDGAGPLVGAFLWSAGLAVLLVPWQDLAAGLGMCGALGANELTGIRQAREAAAFGGAIGAEQVLYYARWAAYPMLTLVVWLMVQVKFSAGCRAAREGSVAVERQGG